LVWQPTSVSESVSSVQVPHDSPIQQQEPLAEIKRLFQERSQLLGSGSYTMDDVVIAQISDRISQLSQTL
jgi:hypothetical protein